MIGQVFNICHGPAIMSFFRYALVAVALAAAQFSAAQAPSGAGDGASAPPATTSRRGAAEKKADSDAEVTPEPRIIRGNDRVVSADKVPPKFEGAPVSFSFEDAPVADVVRTILGDILKVDYVLHPPLSGTVTLSTRAPVPPDQATFLLESALQANGLALLRDARGSFHVGRPDALKSIGGSVRYAGGGGPLPPGYGAIIVPLQYIGAGEMAAILRPLMPADALVRVDTVRNLLVLAGTRTQAEGWLDMVATFDVDLLKGMSVGVFPLKYATTREVEAALRLMAPGASGSNALPSAGAVNAGGISGAANAAAAGQGGQASLNEVNPLYGALRILPIERINSVLVVTPRAAYLDEARRWIERLDQPNDNSGEAQLYIYRVQNGNARHLAGVLAGIFSDGRQAGVTGNTTTGVAPGLASATGTSSALSGFQSGSSGSSLLGSTSGASSGLGLRSGGLQSLVGRTTGTTTGTQSAVAAYLGSIRVMADDLNNAVLVWATRAEYAKIEVTLKRLDLPPTQVLIEASIIEVTLTDGLQYGLQWAFSDSRSSSGYTGRGVLSTTDGTTSGGVLGTALQGFSYTLKNSAGDVRAILNALASKTSVKVIASPSLMVLDNHVAAISVGTQQPIKAGETVSAEGNVRSTNIQYKDTGVNLMVTPSVNAGNIVTMQVDQSVTDVGNVDSATLQREFLQRQVTSKVAVRSGESIVMGGLIQENVSAGKSGIPLLQDIPVLGNLFGTTTNTGRRTELLVVITPRVVRSDIDVREVSDDLRNRMKGLTRVEEQEGGRKAAGPSQSQQLPILP